VGYTDPSGMIASRPGSPQPGDLMVLNGTISDGMGGGHQPQQSTSAPAVNTAAASLTQPQTPTNISPKIPNPNTMVNLPHGEAFHHHLTLTPCPLSFFELSVITDIRRFTKFALWIFYEYHY
jgi:hypothetical protein